MAQWFTDYHMHTACSPDADELATFNAYIEDAELKKHERLVFTDHVDIDSPAELFKDYPQYEHYKSLLNRLQKKTQVELLMGVEIGYQPHVQKAIEALVKRHPFDFVIASLHASDKLDYYNTDFFKGKTDQEATMRYFETVHEMVKSFSDFDVVGHIDYITRYYLKDEKKYDFKTFEPILTAILKTIIAKGKGIEINTSGIRYNLDTFHPTKALLTLYFNLGGKILTLGSDAHKTRDRMRDFEGAKALLKSVGFSHIAQYKARHIQFVKLP